MPWLRLYGTDPQKNQADFQKKHETMAFIYSGR